MSVRRIVEAGAVALVISTVVLGATRSDVADAVMKGDHAAVRTLLQQRADVNAPQADGATALHWAVYRNDLEIAGLLIQAGARVTAANREGATPLSLASINGNAAMIEKLLKAGADPNVPVLSHGETALMLAARTGDVEAIRLLLDYGADAEAKDALRGTTALMWAAAQEHPAAVAALIEYGADVSARSSPATLGRTAYLAPTVVQRTATAGVGAAARGGAARDRGAPGGGRAGRGAGGAAAATQDFDNQDFFAPRQNTNGGGLTPLVLAARQGDLESARILLDAGADVNQVTQYRWTPLLTATQNRYYRLASFLLDHGADANIANKGGWTPLYLATDNRNIEGGDYPVRQPDMDHLEFITKLLDHGANVNARAMDSTETRTIFTMQWLYEDGATPFLRAAQSGDLTLMRLLLARGADPKIPTTNNVTALAVAAGIGWVEGVTYEWSEADNVEAAKMCLDLGIDVNISRDTVNGALLGHNWLPVDYAEGLVRVGVQSAIAHPETAALRLCADR